MKGFVIGGVKSGSGKTTISLGLMASLRRREFQIAPFKVGPDFIDPGYHKQICGTISRNLDGWMLSKEYNIETFERHTKDSDIAIVEGVMGLYDGYNGKSESGSTAQMAKLLKLPVLLVVDAASMARSAAAIVLGFERFDPDVDFLGVIFNRTGSQRHLTYLEDALNDNSKLPCLGGFTRKNELMIKERHLGLVINEENTLSDDYIQTLADSIDASIDMDLLLSRLCETEIQEKATLRHEKHNNRPLIGIARDEAFCFYYQDNLDLLEKYGARLVSFSPLKDKHLPDGLDGLYLGGGYPELHADKISGNATIKKEIYKHAQNGLPVYAECGGLVYLSSAFKKNKNTSYQMVGLFPFDISLLSRIKALGYREIRLSAPCLLGQPGDVIRGHEFHYSELSQQDKYNELAYQIINLKGDKLQKEGFMFKNTLASYIHLHFGSNPKCAENFVNFCSNYSKKKGLRIMKPSEIEKTSFEIIDQEAGSHNFLPDEWSVVRRMIHTSADFEYLKTVCIHPMAIEAGISAIKQGKAIITDTEMARTGIRKQDIEVFGCSLDCFINHPEVLKQSIINNYTRAASAISFAASLSYGGIYIIGNAPTALLRLIDLIENDMAQPALIIGLPVGFVNAAESKARLIKTDIPYISNIGRKGGSNLAASVMNALLKIIIQRENL